MSILKPNHEELPEQSHLAGAHAQPECNQANAFAWLDENYVQKAVKMLCTNYDLESAH